MEELKPSSYYKRRMNVIKTAASIILVAVAVVIYTFLFVMLLLN